MSGSRVPQLAVLAVLAVAASASTCHLALRAEPASADALVLSSLGAELFFGLIALALASLSRQTLGARLGLGPGILGWPEIAVLLAGMLALSHGLDASLSLTGLREHSALLEFERRLEGLRGPGLLLALLALGVAPALGEELFCRGLVQRGVSRRLGARAGLVAGALVFAALHVEPVHAAFALILGLYLGAAAWWSGSIRLPIACHAVNNLAAVLGAAGPVSLPVAPALSAAGGLIAALGALAWVAQRPPRRPASSEGRRDGER
jgi:membrane protease YdiL (CAAX protease family)